MEEVGKIIFDLITENFKDNINENKDLRDYLKEKTKNELMSTYALYNIAICDTNEIVELENYSKEELIEKIMDFLDVQLVAILQFFEYDKMEEVRKLAEQDKVLNSETNKNLKIPLFIINVLRKLNFVFCNRKGEHIEMHMPKFIREKIKKIKNDVYLESYDEILLYTKGLVNAYGAIDFEEAYDIISNDIRISYDRYYTLLSFVSAMELEPIVFSLNRIANYNLSEKQVDELMKINKDIIIYDKKMYEMLGDSGYLNTIQEYNELNRYLKEHYDIDLNEDEILRDELVNNYIEVYQADSNEAKQMIENAIEEYLETDDIEKRKIIKKLDEIRKKMPVWAEGGKITK